MKRLLQVCFLVALTLPAFGDGEVLVPWEELKALYRESVERSLMEARQEPDVPRQVHVIDEARYQMSLTEGEAAVDVVLSGRVVSGGPEPIPLFGVDAVITAIACTSGNGDVGLVAGRVVFLPAGDPGAFQITASLLAPVVETDAGRGVALTIPQALRNALDLTLPAASHLTEAPGLADGAGTYRFAARDELTVAYVSERGMAVTREIELDALTRIRVQRQRLTFTTHFLPVRPLPDEVVLQAPAGAQFVASSLRPSRIQDLGEGRYALNVTGGEAPLWMAFALDIEGDTCSLRLPVIENNRGQEGRFIVVEPDDVRVTTEAAGMVSPIPADRLGEGWAPVVLHDRAYAKAPIESAVTLRFQRYETIPTPATVLPSQSLFSAFEENGSVLSTLMFDVPPEVGPRLTIAAVPDARIWSLRVNDTPRKVLAGDGGAWVVPLDSAMPSKVVLSYLVEGPKLGLHGRLETVLPATGLASRIVRVGIALPNRVDLLNIEGPVGSDPGQGWDVPGDVQGHAYFFSRAFYNGEGMQLAASYKEPVHEQRVPEGGTR